MRKSLTIIGLTLCLAAPVPAQAPPPPQRFAGLDGAFTAEQAQRGASVFAQQCATCHTVPQAATLMLERGRWMTLGAYAERLSATMPPQSTTRPEPQGYVDVIAHLARAAGAQSGSREALATSGEWRQAAMPTDGRVLATAATTSPNLDWRNWRGDIGGAAYSPAGQINRDNVSKLRIAWRWSAANQGPEPDFRSITTPLMVDGTLFATAGLTRNVVAIDAASGEMLWMWRPEESATRFENAPRKGSGRGVSWWSDGASARILTITPGFHLAALDAKTGRPIDSFGRNGVVDLMEGLRGAPTTGLSDIGSSSPPLVIGDVLVVGAAHLISMNPKSKANVKGDVRGFDVRTGKLLWTFHTIPEKGEPGYDTWARGSAEFSGNAGVWAPMSADPATGAIFLPVESATGDRYGGERQGDNLHSSSLVSLDAKTGKLRWARQLIHHDIWDYDTPAIPILGDVIQNGKPRRIVAQITKQSFVYVFDRDTGEPIWPIQERRVPASTVPGEKTSGTQPMPVKPAPFDVQGLTDNDLIDFTPELRAEALKLKERWKLGAFYEPPALVDPEKGFEGVLSVPGALGGANWEGGAFDPETGMIYIASQTSATPLSIRPSNKDTRYESATLRTPQVSGLPLVKPPYGRITAIDLKTGDHAWMIANADTPANIANHPALKGLTLPRTGAPRRAGLLATKTLLFAGEGLGGSPVFRAHDKATGEILAQIPLPGPQSGLPMTYVTHGKQYVVMATGGGATPSEIVALALPD